MQREREHFAVCTGAHTHTHTHPLSSCKYDLRSSRCSPSANDFNSCDSHRESPSQLMLIVYSASKPLHPLQRKSPKPIPTQLWRNGENALAIRFFFGCYKRDNKKSFLARQITSSLVSGALCIPVRSWRKTFCHLQNIFIFRLQLSCKAGKKCIYYLYMCVCCRETSALLS